MKIAVMAAGSVGGYLGGLLARNGNDVWFMARGKHLQAIREKGLMVKSIHGNFTIHPAKANDDPAQVGCVDWILFAVKTYDTEIAAQAIKPMIGKDTTVVTFQNGVESFRELSAVIGKEHVIVAPTQITATIEMPGVIVQDSIFRSCVIGEMDGRITPRVEWFAEQLKQCGVDATASDQMPNPLWVKWIFLSSFAGLTSLARTEGATLFRSQFAQETLRAALREAYQVAVAQGTQLPQDVVDKHFAFIMNVRPGNMASMHKDLMKGKRLEVDSLNGAVVRLGAEKGIETPVHQTIFVALKMEDERARM